MALVQAACCSRVAAGHNDDHSIMTKNRSDGRPTMSLDPVMASVHCHLHHVWHLYMHHAATASHQSHCAAARTCGAVESILVYVWIPQIPDAGSIVCMLQHI
jgi:hypothetical protein